MRILDTGARRNSSPFPALAGDEERVEGVEGDEEGVGVPRKRRCQKDMVRKWVVEN